MSTSLLVVINAGNGYSGSSNVPAVTSQVVAFANRFEAVAAMNELIADYEQVSSMRIKVTLLEGTA